MCQCGKTDDPGIKAGQFGPGGGRGKEKRKMTKIIEKAVETLRDGGSLSEEELNLLAGERPSAETPLISVRFSMEKAEDAARTVNTAPSPPATKRRSGNIRCFQKRRLYRRRSITRIKEFSGFLW